jgi:hypothetical protein
MNSTHSETKSHIRPLIESTNVDAILMVQRNFLPDGAPMR